LRSGIVASSAASTPPQDGDKMSSAPTEPTTSPGPPILSPQVTASEAMRIIDTNDVEDAELLAIADTLISLRAPPSYLPPPLPVQPPPHSALYPAGPGVTLDLTLAPNDKFEPDGALKLGASFSPSDSGSDDVDVDVESLKNVESMKNVKVSVVRSDKSEQTSVEYDDDVDDVLTLAEGRVRGQPGEKVVHVSVQQADHGPPHVPATCATGALRVAGERLSLASDILTSTDCHATLGCVCMIM